MADHIPVGVSVHHGRLGSGRTAAAPRRLGKAWVFIDVEFRSGKRLACSARAVSFLPTAKWPPRRRRLVVQGEVVAESTDDGALRTLLGARLSRLNAEWEAAQDRRVAA